MIEKYLSNLSIHRLGFISSNIAGAIIFIFAILVINQEYKYYEEEISQIEKDYKTSTLAKQKILNEKKIEHKKKIMRYIIGIGGVGLFMFFAIYMLLRVVSFLIENELKEFLSQFSKASKEHVIIDKSNFNFEEFKSLIDNANHLVREIQENEKELLDLNKNLENKVKIKTKKLQTLVSSQDEFIKKSIHEINTPLSIILTNIDLLKIKNIKNKYITNIESGSKIIHNIFNDLSFMLKKDRLDYKNSPINISQFLRNRLEFFDEVANSSDLIFIANIEDNLILEFNEVYLQRVIDNNLSNSIKYSFSNSVIYITLVKDKDSIILKFNTNSQKIENLEKVFNYYYRENDVKGGFGIGLNIVKDICDKNQVKIDIMSNEKETQFEYRFKL
jgi:signal transduction histidine kinase